MLNISTTCMVPESASMRTANVDRLRDSAQRLCRVVNLDVHLRRFPGAAL